MKTPYKSKVAAALASLTLLMTLTAPGWAAGASLTGPVPRWPALVAGALVAALGLLAGQLWRSWEDMGAGARAARVLGFGVASLGAFLVTFSATSAPPLYSSSEALPWIEELEVAEARARSQGKVMMVDFTAEWCGACHELEAEVFNQPEVRERLSRDFVLARVDFDRAAAQQADLLQRFEVAGLPRVAFVSPGGELLRGPSFEGKLTPEAFMDRLEQAEQGGEGEGQSEFARTLGERGLLAALLLVFMAGFLSSLTPCVYPLIPITISLFGARGAESRLEAFSLSATYVLGIAITYSVLGVVAATFGTVFGGAMQHPVVLGALALLFVALGLSSLGVFTLRLPGDLQTKLSEVGGVGYVGALLMGLVAGIIAAPCVGPIVAGVLLYVAQQQSIFLGWLMLFVFALGLGVIFLILGTFSSLVGKLPRSGSWMEGVKAVFAVVFFAMALFYARYLLSPVSHAAEVAWQALAQWVA